MFTTDITDRYSHPFVTRCYEMSLKDLKKFAKELVKQFNDAYEKALEHADGLTVSPWESDEYKKGEELEEQANIANEILDYRMSNEFGPDDIGRRAPTDSYFLA